MSEQYLGEIRILPYGYLSADWLPCNGQLLPVAQYRKLYSLIKNTYGGDGSTTFALPDLRGRVPIHCSPDFPLGKSGGEAAHKLTVNEIPAHEHVIYGSSDSANAVSPADAVWGNYSLSNLYSPSKADTQMHQAALSAAGEGKEHPNMQPYLVLNFCIAVNGNK